MRVHFIASRANIKNDIIYYRQIIGIIEELGHEIIRNWVDEAYKSAVADSAEDSDWRYIAKANAQAITKADLVIAEATTRSFSVGFQTAQAIQQNKSTLLLSRSDSLNATFGSGLTSDILTAKKYNSKTLRTILEHFFEDNTIGPKDLRFNFFINRRINNYLKWASMNSGKPKSQIVRELLLREITRDDF